MLAEFGDDPQRYADSRARKSYSGMAPVTKTSGKSRVVLARHTRNRASETRSTSRRPARSATHQAPDAHRARGNTDYQALRALGNRLVGILDGSLRHHTNYDEQIA